MVASSGANIPSSELARFFMIYAELGSLSSSLRVSGFTVEALLKIAWSSYWLLF
jgi:hypothetical protein